MAYELESQNNSTSTLVDSATGNRIRLRSTAVIANVSYTLVKVNNNIATLQDGEGNILKDVPCVAVLYGEGGGAQVKTMPEANAGNLGKIVQYVGETTTDYHNAYFYKSSVTGSTPSSATVEQTAGTGLEDLAVNKTTFETLIDETGSYDFVAVEGIGGIEWELDEALVDLADYGITFTPADPTTTVAYSSEALGTVTVDTDTFATQVLSGGLYIFDCMVTEDATKWYRGEDEVDLADYGITITGTPEDGNAIHVQYVTQAPHAGDVITVDYTAEAPTYGWVRTNVQPTGGGEGGAVNSVNNIDPVDGNVTLSGADIDSTVGGTEDTIENHMNSLRNDLGDLADDLDLKITNPSGGTAGQYLKKTATGEEWADVQGGGSAKNVITLTGESGTLTSTQIAQVLDDTAVLEIVCDGEVFRLSNKDSTLTYRTFINTNCEASETVSFKVIYVQLNSGAVNYGAWSLEEVSAGGSEPVVETITGNTPTIANVQGNHIYNCTGTLTSLTLTAVETTYAEATIYFTTGASITVNIPASVKTIGYTEFSANTSYIVSFANNTMVIGEINA